MNEKEREGRRDEQRWPRVPRRGGGDGPRSWARERRRRFPGTCLRAWGEDEQSPFFEFVWIRKKQHILYHSLLVGALIGDVDTCFTRFVLNGYEGMIGAVSAG